MTAAALAAALESEASQKLLASPIHEFRLDEHAGAMSRTTLSYASEHLDADERARLRNIPRS